MQKQSKLFILIALMFLFSPEFVSAGIISLPRYTGEFAYRSNSGGRDKTCSSSYKYTCSGTGYTSGSGTSCDDKYQSCVCAANYKWSGGACVLKGCSDYGYSASEDTTKSCTKRNPRTGLDCWECSSCNSTTYKYTCSGGLNASTQGTSNKCGTNYSECECVEHASWNSSSGKCECGSDYKASGTSCVLKGCTDYNSSYLTTEDKTKSCTKLNPRTGLECWNCSACSGTLYDCGNMANASGGSGTACGGKYPQCTCKSGYFWDSGKCSLSCTPSPCTGSSSCNGKACTIFRPTAIAAATDLGTGIGTYEVCTPKNCSGDSYQYGYLPTGCAAGYVNWCSKPETDCAKLGYTKSASQCADGYLRCPYDSSAVFCED